MGHTRRYGKAHRVKWQVVAKTSLRYEGRAFRLIREGKTLTVTANDGQRFATDQYAKAEEATLVVSLTPGCETYHEARAYHRKPFSDCDLVAAVVVAAVTGHPDADQDRAGTRPSTIWSHHLAIVGGDDPRSISGMYAPTETKRIGYRVQQMAARGVRVSGCGVPKR
jgi:hypothetical protein